VLGISADFHDAAAAVVVDGRVVAAVAEERLSRVKHDPSLPERAVRWCLGAAGVDPGSLDLVVFYEKPLSVVERIFATHAEVGPRGLPQLASATSAWAGSKAWIGYRIDRLLRGLGHRRVELAFAEHHQSHAAAAFLPSPFERAAVVTFDGVGEWATTSIAVGHRHKVELLAEQRFPDSIGLLYSTITDHCGFEVNEGEYKLMGLAPYGEPSFVDVLRDRVLHVADDGSFRLDQRWFDYRAGRRMGHRRLAELLGPPRTPEQPLTRREADLARSVQVLVEDVVLRVARHARHLTGERALCLAGGVALNCVANGHLIREGVFDDVWIQPAAGDDGGALGAALWGWHEVLGEPRTAAPTDGMSGAALGPSYPHEEIAGWLDGAGVGFRRLDDGALFDEVAGRLAGGDVVGWFRGRCEYGPRALGQRSILADPRDVGMIQRINVAVKGREGFRPFAPAVLAEDAADWFELDRDLPYMLATVAVRDAVAEPVTVGPDRDDFAGRIAVARSRIPACTHVDGSARVQTVTEERSPDLHRLLRSFRDRTGCPVLLNTSFNRRGEPIVCSPADALRCFEAVDLDLLVLGDCLVERRDLPTAGRT
jgi:carbamoyltransferase